MAILGGLRFGQLPSRPPSAARPCTRCCRFGASVPIPFPGVEFNLFKVLRRHLRATPSASRAAIWATQRLGLRCRTINSAAASSETATQESTRIEFPSAFWDFSRLCKAENFPSGRNAATPLPRDRRSAMAENDVCDRLVPDALLHRPMRAPLRGARRRDLNVVVGHSPAPRAKGETGRFQTLA